MLKSIFIYVLHTIFFATILALSYVLSSSIAEYYRQAASVLLLMYISSFTYELSRNIYFKERIDSKNKAILITGCDTGFGHELAKRLDSLGFTVFASCLHPSGNNATALKETCSSKLQILELDVTKVESVKRAVNFVKKSLESCELWAVVNNAGVQNGFTFEFSSMSEYESTMDVNAFGMVRVTKSFLPLLRKCKGRIINMASIAGRIPVPYIGPYCMSKHAAVAFSECLKQEMDPWGIKVILIEPELFQTPMVHRVNLSKRAKESLRNRESNVQELYDEKVISKLQIYIESLDVMASKHISCVINDLETAICLKNPAAVYRPCRNIVTRVLGYVALHAPLFLTELICKLFLYLSNFPLIPKQSTKSPQSYVLLMKNICNILLLRLFFYIRLHPN